MGEITNLAGVIRVHGAAQGDKTALILGERSLSWSELRDRSARAAQGLLAAGVAEQERVAFLDKNGFEHFEIMFGAAMINAVCVDVNWRLAAPEVEFIVNDTEAKVLVVGPDFVPILDAIADNLTHVTTVVVIGGHERFRDYEEWILSLIHI